MSIRRALGGERNQCWTIDNAESSQSITESTQSQDPATDAKSRSESRNCEAKKQDWDMRVKVREKWMVKGLGGERNQQIKNRDGTRSVRRSMQTVWENHVGRLGH